MILEFTIKNYRSFKEECCFSLLAESSKSKEDNVFEHVLANGEKLRLLKSAVVYGANASGKSNLLKAFNTLIEIIQTRVTVGKPIKFYDPFRFDKTTQAAPTIFNLTFIGPSNCKYIYKITFDAKAIQQEELYYYPKTQKRNLFKRVMKEGDESIHAVKLGQDFLGHKTISIYHNQSALSKFGNEEADELLTPVFLYFQKEIGILDNIDLLPNLYFVEQKMAASPTLKKRLNNLIDIADTKIKGLVMVDRDEFKVEPIFGAYGNNPDRPLLFAPFAKHVVYKNKKKVSETELPMKEESKGTNVLYVMGAYILDVLEKGGVFIIDEIDTSLHPRLAKFLVMLFQNPVSNPKNAQLIFTTHETTFLDKDLFRKDQIWFVEKNKYGESELFSVQDFDGVREDTPFEKWYLAGKFGGVPNIREIEFIFSEE